MIICQHCSTETEQRHPSQKYCVPCSESQAAKRAGRPVALARQRSIEIERGLAVSENHARRSLFAGEQFVPDEGWVAKFKIPFSLAASKNHVWSLGKGGGHVFKRQQSSQYQDLIALQAKSVTRDLRVYENKIWIDLFVQKPHHKGDAINVIDLVCDGLKIGLGVDDRWFCIRQVDWEIAKNDPQIFVGIYQRDTFDARACSHCGRVLALEHFGKNKSNKLGVGRVCGDCRKKPSPLVAVTVRAA